MARKDGRTDSVLRALREGEMDIREMQVVLDLYRELYPVASQPVKPAGRVRFPGKEEARMRLQEGFHLLDLPSLIPSGPNLNRRAAEILDILGRHARDREADSATYALLRQERKIRELAVRYLEGGEEKLRSGLPETGGINPEIAMFTTFNCLKGVFLEAARSLEGIETSQWEQLGCPLCGGVAAVGFLVGEGGQRHVVCHRCETRWRVSRLQCPYCRNTDHKTLGYFTIEGDMPEIRVEFCRKCTRYIKTWDLREREHRLPEVEDLRTARFDQYAESEGFHRGGPNIFGVWIGFEQEREKQPQP